MAIFEWLRHTNQQRVDQQRRDGGVMVRRQYVPESLVKRLRLHDDTLVLVNLNRPIEHYVDRRSPFELLDAAMGNLIVQEVHVGPELYKCCESAAFCLFVEKFVERLPSLKVLTICAEESAAIRRLSAESLANMVRSARNLTSLVVGCDVVLRNAHDVDDLTRALTHHPALENIVLSNLRPEFTDCRLCSLINAIATIPNLQTVKIGTAGMIPVLAYANLGVTSLDEWQNAIRPFLSDPSSLYMVLRSTLPCFISHRRSS